MFNVFVYSPSYCRNGEYFIWDVNSKKSTFSGSLQCRSCSSLKWHPCGDVFCVGCKTRIYQIIDPRNNQSVCEWIVYHVLYVLCRAMNVCAPQWCLGLEVPLKSLPRDSTIRMYVKCIFVIWEISLLLLQLCLFLPVITLSFLWVRQIWCTWQRRELLPSM